MDEESRKRVDRRLARIEGQVRGLRRMLEQGDYCCDILTQLAATRSALDQAGAEIVTSHVRSCILGKGSGSEHESSQEMTSDELVEELKITIERLMR